MWPRLWLAVLAMLLAASAAAAWALTHRPNSLVIRTVSVGISPATLTVDSLGRRVIIANTMGNNLSILDSSSGDLVATIAVDATPQAVALDAHTGHIFVTTTNGGVRLLSGHPLASRRTMQLGAGASPLAVSIDEQSGRVFVASASTGTEKSSMSVFSAGRGDLLSRYPLAVAPGPMAVDAGTGHVFMANLGGRSASMLDGASGRLLRTVALPGPPSALAIAGRSGRVFVVQDGSPGAVSVLDTRSGALLRTVQVGNAPVAIAVDTATGTAFVVNAGSGVSRGSVSVLDAVSGTVLRTVATGLFPTSIAIDEGTDRAVVVNGGNSTVSILDAATGEVVGTAPVGRDPQQVAVDPMTHRAFVINLGGAPEENGTLAAVVDGMRTLLGQRARPAPFSGSGSVTVVDTGR